jgi:hypothetical protein
VVRRKRATEASSSGKTSSRDLEDDKEIALLTIGGILTSTSASLIMDSAGVLFTLGSGLLISSLRLSNAGVHSFCVSDGKKCMNEIFKNNQVHKVLYPSPIQYH